MSEKKIFQELSKEDTKDVIDKGGKVYLDLVDHFGKSKESGTQIMNTLCFGLVCVMKNRVAEDDRRVFCQLVHKILMSNIEENIR